MQAIAESAHGIDDIDDLLALSIEDLKERLFGVVADIVGNYREGARVVRALEEKGVDLSDFPMPDLLQQFRMIACGRLLPETVARFVDKPLLFSKIGGLPPEDQRKYAIDGDLFEVAVPVGATGETTKRLVPPEKMTATFIAQVFTAGTYPRVRDFGAQCVILESRNAQTLQSSGEEIGPMTVDPAGRCVYVGKVRISEEELRRAVVVLKRVRASRCPT